MYFRYFVIISLSKRTGPFILTNLNPFYLRILCAKFGWNWPCGSWEDKIVKSLQQKTTTATTDDGQISIRKAPLSIQLRWAKKCKVKKVCKPTAMNNVKNIAARLNFEMKTEIMFKILMKLGKNTLMFNDSVEQNISPSALGTTPRVLLPSANGLGQ